MIQRLSAAWHKVASPARVGAARRKGAQIGSNVQFIGPVLISIHDAATISIGANARLVSDSRWTDLGAASPVALRTVHPGARLTIGEGVGMSGVQICAAISVVIGARSLLGSGVRIFDTDFHPIDSIPRLGRPVPPPVESDAVVVGDDVFVGADAIILKGVTIGDGAVIGAGSVVTRDVQPFTVHAGNPARMIRQIAASEAGVRPLDGES